MFPKKISLTRGTFDCEMDDISCCQFLVTAVRVVNLQNGASIATS